MINLDAVIHTEVVTLRSILNETLKDKTCIEKLRSLKLNETLTVNHQHGNCSLTYDECQDILALWRMRGKL
jgi:hypothetical protein